MVNFYIGFYNLILMFNFCPKERPSRPFLQYTLLMVFYHSIKDFIRQSDKFKLKNDYW